MDAKNEKEAILKTKLKEAKREIKVLEDQVVDLEVKVEDLEEALKEANMQIAYLRRLYGHGDEYP